MNRACGYCREIGHTSNKCGLRLGQIDAILRHVGRERKALEEILISNGLGVGAIVRQNFYGNTGSESVIISLSDTIGGSWDSAVEWSIVKYRKSVRSRLRSWSGVQHGEWVPNDGMIRLIHTNRIYIQTRSLDDMSRSEYTMFYLSQLPKPPAWSVGQHLYATNSSEILCPSDESDVQPSDYVKQIVLHDRLGKNSNGSRYWTPYAP